MKLIKFYAPWCAPCKTMSDVMTTIDHPMVERMLNINIDENIDAAKKYNVRSIPTMIVVDEEDNEIRRMSGSVDKERITEFLG